MKGIIVENEIFASTLDCTHGHGQMVKRIIIPEVGNLAITLHGDQIYVFSGYEMDDESKRVKEIEVPNELVQKAIACKKAQDDFFQLKGNFQELL
jgi:hypothetical protein